MQDAICARPAVDSHRHHQAAALGQPVAGIDIHVPAPQAARAMVSVTIALHLQPAVAAGEIFDCALEAARQLTRPFN